MATLSISRSMCWLCLCVKNDNIYFCKMEIDYVALIDTIVKVITFVLCIIVVIIVLVAIIKIWRSSKSASTFIASLFA